MTSYVKVGKLQVAANLYEFINAEAIPGTGISAGEFWLRFQDLVTELAPENKRLVEKREELQKQINQWHQQHRDGDFEKYKAFLEEIGYIEEEVEEFEVTTTGVDAEIAKQAGPQLVVPVNNARYALNAANARWGSLYDALYGTDAISEEEGCERGSSFNPLRGQKVIEFGKKFLDSIAPLNAEASHGEVRKYRLVNGHLMATLRNDQEVDLMETSKLVGYRGDEVDPEAILLQNHGLHVEIQIDREHPIGKTDEAGVKDILIEAALTTIMDCEDSVAAVDAEDKVEVYRNWLGLMKCDLTASFNKGEKTITRTLAPDREYTAVAGTPFTLRGRSLMFVRNVGHLMTINAVLDENGQEVPEGILDGVITSLIAIHNLKGNGLYKNSTEDSVYIVKPKMHGSEEVAFANKLFNRIEDILELNRYTLKIGVMDEERRTSLNLKNCIHAVKERIVFINTGFLDRTGDEMHTSMEAGPMIRKHEMKSSTWLQAYEKSNVANGLSSGLQGRAQIGKGMWAMPDLMAEMMKQKIGQLHAGANTAWVPSPTAAVLHALHYHEVNVTSIQNELVKITKKYQDDILDYPVANEPNWESDDIQRELNNNAQGILGYVVRWVEQGIGCSKVPDINNVGLMEDRATLRISSQHVANWLYHGICSGEQVLETLKRMAKIVDKQNAADPNYQPMANDFNNSIAFQAACELIFEGRQQPSGYTEPILHRRRLEAKAKAGSTVK
ncbi:malate synthase G [Halalkalibacter urbisdiaboli]|uniref:malate synthase G n=1 Tax=Halalkalibacter urbisdiaboli TaxID=1960589 RepID=UPI000B450ED0|nr:malate synthase G [Halalkalibacter urbisdiaboli]